MQNLQIIGFIGRDAISQKTQDGKDLVVFSVGVTKKYTSKETGEITENTTWYSVFKRFNDASKVVPHLTKGKKVFVSGEPVFEIEHYQANIKMNINIQCSILDF